MITERSAVGNEPHGSTSAALGPSRAAGETHVCKASRRSALAAFFDPALDRDRDLLHPPVDSGPPFAAAPQRRAGLSDAGKEAAHRSGEHNREPERNKEPAGKESGAAAGRSCGPRPRPPRSVTVSGTASPCQRSPKSVSPSWRSRYFTSRQSSAYEPLSNAAYGVRGT